MIFTSNVGLKTLQSYKYYIYILQIVLTNNTTLIDIESNEQVFNLGQTINHVIFGTFFLRIFKRKKNFNVFLLKPQSFAKKNLISTRYLVVFLRENVAKEFTFSRATDLFFFNNGENIHKNKIQGENPDY